MSLEYEIAAIGHYPEKRSANRGVEPEGIEVAEFAGVRYIFVMAERASVVGVYRDTGGDPELVQLLPSGISPESAVAIPSRNLLVTANETDASDDGGARAQVMIYELGDARPAYPQIRSLITPGRAPIGWGALSGLTADPVRPGILYAVNDRFYRRQPTIFTIDATARPATITGALRVTRDGSAAKKLDLEGIASDGQGGFWLASEGGAKGKKAHTVLHVGADGEIDREIALPRKLKKVARRHGFEGIAVVGSGGAGDDTTLWMAVQREWKDDEDGFVKLVSYRVKTGIWGAVRYPLDRPETGWVGLSAMAAHAGQLYIVERDNAIGDAARIKKLYRVAVSDLAPAPIGGDLPIVTKHLARDFMPYLKALNGVVAKKIEGFAVDASGIGYAVTDNDGVDGSSGETLFFPVGLVARR
jgi:hypothetical protein